VSEEANQGQQAEKKLPFDQFACAVLRQAHAAIFAHCPEVRSVGSTLDFYGALNDAPVQKGVWSSDHGPVDTADGIFGSMFQTLRLMEEQFGKAIELGAQMRDDIQALTEENVKLREINEQLQGEIERRAQQLGIGTEVGDGVPADGDGG
jgi:hypothetical protein